MNLIIILSDDYEWVYGDGELLCEGHSISALDILTILKGKKLKSYKYKYAKIDPYNIPEKLEDFIFE